MFENNGCARREARAAASSIRILQYVEIQKWQGVRGAIEAVPRNAPKGIQIRRRDSEQGLARRVLSWPAAGAWRCFRSHGSQLDAAALGDKKRFGSHHSGLHLRALAWRPESD